MNKWFYPKLAITNIKKNSQTYIPYMLTCICTMMMFFVMHAISINDGLNEMPKTMTLMTILNLGTIVIGIFSTIFLFYTNSFLIKRRKKEIGLYNVLGMEKKHIAIVLFFENVFTSILTLVIGLGGGILLNKLMFIVLLRLLQFDIPLGFEISVASIEVTSTVFIGIFIVTLICNLVQIQVSKPIELLKGGQVGEKEPKTKWIRAIIGLISLTLGYGIALGVETPLAAINLFFVAVIFVMIGTYQLFTAGSIAILKLLRKNKRYYYKSQNFIAISGMMYRMKQNAKGLANICILSTAVLVMLSTTLSLYVGMEDALRYRFPKDVSLMGFEVTDESIAYIEQLVNEKIDEYQINPIQQVAYLSKKSPAIKQARNFELVSPSMFNPDAAILEFMSVDDFNRLENTKITLSDDEMLIFTTAKNYGKNSITINNQTYRIQQELEEVAFATKNEMDIMDTYILIVNDINEFGDEPVNYQMGFDVDNKDESTIEFVNSLNTVFKNEGLDFRIDSLANNRDDFLATYGGLFFLGIFLGSLFLMATVLIIYYKQISEGYDDKERFKIMQKVGMSKQEIKKTIRIQILMVFFLPLAFAALHIAAAFPIITKLLAMLNLVNSQLFLISTIGTLVVFGIIYALIFSLTARTYYKIVE